MAKWGARLVLWPLYAVIALMLLPWYVTGWLIDWALEHVND